MARIVVIGGGVAGLGAALALSRDGHAVTVLERDAMPLPATPVEAFAGWERPGAPQVWHSHAFLARLRNLLLERAPDVRERLLEHGAYELRFGDSIPPTVRDFRPEPSDAELVLLACRRITFEWVLRRAVLEGGGVTWRGGAEVVGLEAQPDPATGVPRVTGVRTGGRGRPAETLPADLVVDASGRRSLLPHWLAALGAREIEEESEPCGIFYCSRFYRLRPGVEAPSSEQLLVAADLGYMKFAVFPGDSGIFSTTLAAPPEDAPLRAILRTRQYEAAVRAIPAMQPWIDPARSEPITEVRGMASLRSQRRGVVRDGLPVALGVHAIGDAALHTNPLYGRGCALALVHAYLLADAFRAHRDDPVACAIALDAATRREIEPWYRAAVAQDRDAREVALAQLRGEAPEALRSQGEAEPRRAGRPASPADSPQGSQASEDRKGVVVDPKAFQRSVFRDGLLPALRTDAVVLRAFVRGFNLLAPPEELIRDPDLIRRVFQAWQERHQRAPEAPQGPPREAMVEVLRAA